MTSTILVKFCSKTSQLLKKEKQNPDSMET